MQVYCVLIVRLLMVAIRKKAVTKKSFAKMITVIRLHLMSYVELMEFIKDAYKHGERRIMHYLHLNPIIKTGVLLSVLRHLILPCNLYL